LFISPLLVVLVVVGINGEIGEEFKDRYAQGGIDYFEN
jgi:hypothetical protein